MSDNDDQLQIGAFGELVGLSVPQLRRYDRLGLLQPRGRSDSGYRFYSSRQRDEGRAIALLRSMDMPIADIRELLDGPDDDRRQELFENHRARLEERLDATHRLLDAVDAHTERAPSAPPTWLQILPRLHVSDIDRSLAYYSATLGLRSAWRTSDGALAAVASGDFEILLLLPWTGDGDPPRQSLYVYVEDPDALDEAYGNAGATIVDPVESRPNGMRDFTIVDPDGHRITLGCGEEELLALHEYYGLESDEITINRVQVPRDR